MLEPTGHADLTGRLNEVLRAIGRPDGRLPDNQPDEVRLAVESV
jgi:hypothetical protein